MNLQKNRLNKSQAIRGGVFILLCFILLILSFTATLYFKNSNDSASYGVYVGNVHLQNVTYANALEIFNKQVEDVLSQETIFVLGDESVSIPLATTGVEVDIDNTLRKAYSIGREEPFIERIYKQLELVFSKENVPFEISFNDDTFNKYVNNNLKAFYDTPKNTQVKYDINEKDFYIDPSSEGFVIDTNALQQSIANNIQNLQTNNISVTLHSQKPQEVQDEEHLKQIAQTIANKDVYMNIKNHTNIPVPKEEIAKWITLTYQEDESVKEEYSISNIQQYLENISDEYSLEPRNLRFTISNGVINIVEKSYPGYSIKTLNGAHEIERALKNDIKTVYIPTEVVSPTIHENNAYSFEFTLIGSGDSNFGGSPNNRTHNISIGSEKYQGITLAPDEEFSFNDRIGVIGASTGYLPELVIKNGRTIPEYGGGLCQVSTTIFRAAVNSGMKITSRRNHSYVVGYYGDPGFDATIYPPTGLDFKFQNNTEDYILLQYKIEEERLVFEIYGKDDGRQVQVTGPITYDVQTNGSMKAKLEQKVLKNGQVIYEDTIYSNYRSSSEFPIERNPLE